MTLSTVRRVLSLSVIAALVLGCAPLPSPAATQTISLTSSPTATPTAVAIATPTPTSTTTPTPRPTVDPAPFFSPVAPQVVHLAVWEGDNPGVQSDHAVVRELVSTTGKQAAEAELDTRRPTIKLAFNQAMDRTSVREALAVTPSLPLELNWDASQGTTALSIASTRPLAPGREYTFVLGSRASSRQGLALTAPYTWTLRTKPLVAAFHHPTQINREKSISLRFNYAMDTRSVEQALRIEPAIGGNLQWSSSDTVATFRFGEVISASTAYTVGFVGSLLDANGDPFLPPDPYCFVSPPAILSAIPTGKRVSPLMPIQITFDRLMDQNTVEEALQIEPDVPGYVSWDETTLWFEPQGGYLAENAVYTVTVGTEARGANGEWILQEPYTWTFGTGKLGDVASFGWGPNAQVLDTDGRRAVQYVLYSNAPQMDPTFELYTLSLEQFLDRYASGFRGVAGSEKRPISTEGTALAKRWTVALEQLPKNRRDVQEVTIPGDVSPGLYVMNATAGHVNDQLVLVLTSNALTVKQAEGQIVAWVTNINGGPVPGADVAVYARDGELISQGQADASGVYRTEVTKDPQPLIVVARQGDDVTACGLSNEWQNSYDPWWGWWQTAPATRSYAAYLYTDRPIYRPGQTVFFKAVLRSDDDAVLDVPPVGMEVVVRIRDGRNNVVTTMSLSTNAFGTVHGVFDLAEGAMLGTYAIEATVDLESHRQTFKVEDYRKPDYRVAVTANGERFVHGETVEGMVESAYFFGEPVSNAKVRVSLYQMRERYWWETDGEGRYVWYVDKGLKEGHTDADGRLAFAWTATLCGGEGDAYWGSSLRQCTWGIEATVDDGSNQPVSGFAVLHVYSAVESAHLDTGGYLHKPGQSIPVEVQVTSILNDVVADRAVTLSVRRWTSSRRSYETVVQSLNLTTGPDGIARGSLVIEEPGYYQVRAESVDGRGNSVRYSRYVFVFSRQYPGWYGRDSDLSISADRASYAPGDTARLLVESAFSGPALLTFERGRTRREQLVELTAPVTMIEVLILPEDVPNIYVTINIWQAQDQWVTGDMYWSLPDSYLHRASVSLSVPADDKRLSVAITPDKTAYSPREEATFTVRVTDRFGEPVAAEVSLALVDEAIFALSEELAGPIFDAFYYRRDNIVRTYDALALRRYLTAVGGGLGGGGGGDGLAANPRSDFPDTAKWLPALQTDANGEVVITLSLPDSLTSWRLTVKAVTVDTRVGEAYVNVLTRQQVVVRPILPRILTVGDHAELVGIVHNYGETQLDVAVSVSQGKEALLAIADPITQVLTLAPGERRVVGWSTSVQGAGEAKIIMRADVGDRTADAVLLPVPIQPLAMPDVDVRVGQFQGQRTVHLDIPEGALAMSSVRIELSRSVAGTLFEGLEYLTGFPFGCVEQTMSRALPNAVVGRAFHQLGVGDPTMQADLPPKINASLQRLYGFQHNDGGWGWWYDDSSDSYQTAWVVFGLTMIAEAGYEVDPAVIERGVEWLKTHVDSMDVRTGAYALYSMAAAGYPDAKRTLALADRLDELDTFGRAGLALALYKGGEVEAAMGIVEYLADTAEVRGARAYWDEGHRDGKYHQKTMSSSTRSTAMALDALVQIAPGHRLEPDIVRWLMEQRKQHGWGTTNETSYAIIALTDHLLATSYAPSATSTEYAVLINDREVASGTLGRGEPAVSLEIPVDQLETGVNALTITQSGDGRLYYVVSSRVYLAQEAIEAAGEIEVQRVYLDPRTKRPVEAVVPGQLVLVQLQVALPRNGAYILVEDYLPGGLQALNERLNTTSHVAVAWGEPKYYWREYGYNHKEVYGDRVCFFITEMGSGRRTFTYMARATHAGQFVAMPVEVSAMYDLSFWGRSASGVLTVVE